MQYYTVFGQKVGAHVLSMITLGSTAAIATYSLSGSKEKKKEGPPLNAGSKDEEEFINNFLKEAQKEEKGEKAKA